MAVPQRIYRTPNAGEGSQLLTCGLSSYPKNEFRLEPSFNIVGTFTARASFQWKIVITLTQYGISIPTFTYQVWSTDNKTDSNHTFPHSSRCRNRTKPMSRLDAKVAAVATPHKHNNYPNKTKQNRIVRVYMCTGEQSTKPNRNVLTFQKLHNSTLKET